MTNHMLYREIIAVCSQIHTKHINTVCGQNVELVNGKLVVHSATTVVGAWWPLYLADELSQKTACDEEITRF